MAARKKKNPATSGSLWLAGVARGQFIKRKRSLLRAVSKELKTPREILVLLERLYAKQVKAYLRADGTTYAEWLERGPRDELEEVREARRDDAVWDRLVDRAAQEAA